MNLLKILDKLDAEELTDTQAAKALAKHLDPFLIATALIEIRRQRNDWRDLHNAR